MYLYIYISIEQIIWNLDNKKIKPYLYNRREWSKLNKIRLIDSEN